MALNHYVTLGRSGLRVSPFCLGTMTFGTQWGWGSDDQTSTRILERYIDAGGNFLDTANIYTKGYSEDFIGRYFQSRQGSRSNSLRDRLVIATKFMGNLYLKDPNGGGAGRKAVIAACEQSLRRLRTDYIDLYWAHFWDRHTPMEEMVRAMEDLVRAGKVRYLGLSDHPAWVCAHCQHLLQQIHGSPLVALQIEYSLIERSVEGELMPMAQHFGMGVTPWSPLKGGLLTGKFTREGGEGRASGAAAKADDRSWAIVDAVVAVGRELGVSPAQVALAWVQGRPGVDSTIIGARTIEQLESNLGALELSLGAEHTARLDEASAMRQAFPHDFVEGARTVIHGGTTINGVSRDPWDLAPASDEERL